METSFRIKYFLINKKKCPLNCVFRNTGNIALIPPPKKVLGMIISRDPPIKWLKFYRYVIEEYEDRDIQRNIFSQTVFHTEYLKESSILWEIGLVEKKRENYLNSYSMNAIGPIYINVLQVINFHIE